MINPWRTSKILDAVGKSFSGTIKAMLPHCLCGHTHSEHSEILAGEPCLGTHPRVTTTRWLHRLRTIDIPCDCPGWMPRR